jgi:hypothetical protein
MGRCAASGIDPDMRLRQAMRRHAFARGADREHPLFPAIGRCRHESRRRSADFGDLPAEDTGFSSVRSTGSRRRSVDGNVLVVDELDHSVRQVVVAPIAVDRADQRNDTSFKSNPPR